MSCSTNYPEASTLRGEAQTVSATSFGEGGPVTSSMRPRLTIEGSNDVILNVMLRDRLGAQKAIREAIATSETTPGRRVGGRGGRTEDGRAGHP